MTPTADQFPTGIAACDCLTPFGDAASTVAALLENKTALEPHPVLGRDGGDRVPLALVGGGMDEALPPRWLEPVRALAKKIPAADEPWGSARFPVVVASSNFGVGSMYAFTRDRDARHLAHGPPFASVELVRRELGWGAHVHVFSHACVTAHVGLTHAARLLHAGVAERVLAFAFDFVSPFVAGGFHSLKILNGAMPAPYAARDIGAIGLGDGVAFAVLTREPAPFRIEAQALFNEMHHFTANQPEGAGFAACLEPLAPAIRGRRVWVKGHGTGTLEAGRLEAEAIAKTFPGAPLVSWKGALGHTLGSCGLVELALACAALRGGGKIPGTVRGAAPSFTPEVARDALAADAFDAAVLASNAFGGAHAAMVLSATPRGESPPALARPGLAEVAREERFLHRLHVEGPPDAEDASAARSRLANKFPRAALRRMTHLGLLLGAALENVPIGRDDAFVYASRFAETRALEDFLASFPAASPLGFQTSIHPSAVQQVLIGRQQPIARLWPHAGGARIVEQALLSALLEPAERVIFAGGEERGTWLREHGVASERSFAFGALLTRDPAGALARVSFRRGTGVPPVGTSADQQDADAGAPPALADFTDALAGRRALAWSGAGGSWALEWL